MATKSNKKPENSIVLLFNFEKETKRTHRFAEEPRDGKTAVGMVYVQKETLAEIGNPETLVVTIAAGPNVTERC